MQPRDHCVIFNDVSHTTHARHRECRRREACITGPGTITFVLTYIQKQTKTGMNAKHYVVMTEMKSLKFDIF